jgi:hypothetical protein
MALAQVVLHVVHVLEGLPAVRTGHGAVRDHVTGTDVFGQIEPGDEGVTVGTGHSPACKRGNYKWDTGRILTTSAKKAGVLYI